MVRFFTLTFEGHVKHWFHKLPTASIHSLKHLVKDIRDAFAKYDY